MTSQSNRYQLLVLKETWFGDEVWWSLTPGIYWTTERTAIEAAGKGTAVVLSREEDDGSPPTTLKTEFGPLARGAAIVVLMLIRWLMKRTLRW